MSPRARLSQADYVSAAFEVADEQGMQALTLKSLGSRLGVDSTAVYRHFRSKDVLLLAMLDRLVVEVLEPPTTHASPRAEVEHIASVLRDLLLAHPPLAVALAAVDELPDHGMRVTDRVVDALSRMGVSGPSLVVHYQLIEHFVLGACLFDGDSSAGTWEMRKQRYARIGTSEFRAAGRSESSARSIAETAYSTGIRLVLDSCEAAAAPTAALG
jgi:AcrR family transcriptional regulator